MHDKKFPSYLFVSTHRDKVKKQNFCKCSESSGVYTVDGMWGSIFHCSACEKPLEDGFQYYSDKSRDMEK